MDENPYKSPEEQDEALARPRSNLADGALKLALVFFLAWIVIPLLLAITAGAVSMFSAVADS